MSRARLAPRAAALALAVFFALLLGTVTVNSTRWVGRTFPGFFLVVNRVVPSVALPEWDGRPSRLFQHQVLAVDGVAVESAAAAYAEVQRRPPGTLVTYRLRAPDATETTTVVPSRPFGVADWFLLFGAYLLTGVAFVAAGLIVLVLKPEDASARGLCAAGVMMGLWAIPAPDLYGPHWFVRLHLVGETLVIASYLHLAVVFPTVRVHRHRGLVLAALYTTFGGLAALYELALPSPSAYTAMHQVATAGHVVGLLAVIAAVGWDWIRTPSALVRRRIAVVALGTVAAFVMPLGVFAASALLGGSVPVNVTALTAFLFPLTLGYAIVTHDLFEIDVMLRRAATYMGVVGAISVVHLGLLLLAGRVVPIRDVATSPALAAVLNLTLLLAIAPVRSRVQAVVDRLFFRTGYDVERALAGFSHVLVSAHTTADVVDRTRDLLARTVVPESHDVLVCDATGGFRSAAQAAAGPAIDLPDDLVRRLARGDVASRYEWDDGTGRTPPAVWRVLAADLLLAMRRDHRVTGLLVLGPKRSGRPYGHHDIALLQAAANQVALGLANAQAFDELAALNASLEDQVRERTAALATANDELARSLEQLRTAYARLEQNQTSLIRADRLATLGRLTAGIAHEVNTPLSAVMNALASLGRLADEYTKSIEHPAVTPDDHREIARELIETTGQAALYARRAAAFINKVKMHGRDHRSGTTERFSVRRLVAETKTLLAHRLHGAGCTLVYEEDPEGVSLVGEPARLAQVLVNLVTNAVDAYEDRPGTGGPVVVHARQAGEEVVISVHDQAGGMPPEVAEHIFEELYTTKEPGRGTGLGLWIGRNLIEESFGGTLVAETRLGKGSCFTIRIPVGPTAPSLGATGAAA